MHADKVCTIKKQSVTLKGLMKKIKTDVKELLESKDDFTNEIGNATCKEEILNNRRDMLRVHIEKLHEGVGC